MVSLGVPQDFKLRPQDIPEIIVKIPRKLEKILISPPFEIKSYPFTDKIHFDPPLQNTEKLTPKNESIRIWLYFCNLSTWSI
jgi:hypothetical protein